MNNTLLKDKRMLVLIGVGVILFLVLLLGGGNKDKKSSNKAALELTSKYKALSTNIEIINNKLDERITKVESNLKKQKEDLVNLKNNINALNQNQQKIVDTLQQLQMQMQQLNNEVKRLNGRVSNIKVKAKRQMFREPPARITAINISQGNTQQTKKKVKRQESKYYIKLPDASIVRGTIVSGIYAPVTTSQWLPTLINVDEAFYGPNNTKIPLRNCKLLAKAQGNYTTQRASVEIYELSCVLPNGVAKHFKVKGYLSDSKDGAFGVKGKIISVTGKYVAGTFLTSFLSGAAGGISQAQTTQTVTSSGATVSSVTGSVGKYMAYSGLANSFGELARYYKSKLDKMVDMVYVPTGKRVWIVIQKGATIDGYQPQEVYSTAFGGVD